MDAILLHSSPDRSISPYNQNIRNPRKTSVPLISHPSDQNFAPSIIHGGPLYTPHPSLSYSYPPFSHLRTQQHQHQPQPQPPLLPLPITNPYVNNSRSRGLSCPPINRKINNRSKHQSLTPKKSKPSITSPQKSSRRHPLVSDPVKYNGESKLDRSKSITSLTKISPPRLMIESTNRLGPDPKDLPKVVSRVLSSSSSGNFSNNNNNNNGELNNNTIAPIEDQVVKFSGSVMFTPSPPPSSLPLPTFFLRPNLSCKAEAAAAEIDAGATDSLRRLLRLR